MDHAALNGVMGVFLAPATTFQLSTGLERSIVVQDLKPLTKCVGGNVILLGNFPCDLVREAVEAVRCGYPFYAVLGGDTGVVILLFEQCEA